MTHDAIAVLDFGGQYAHLIASKLRSLHFFAELKDSRTPAGELRGYRGIVLSGSPSLASQGEGDDYDAGIFDLKIPLLGLCFGHQEIAKHYGGKVEHTGREFGPATLHRTAESPLLDGLDDEERVWMSHQDSVVALPEGFVELGYTVARGGKTHRNSALGDPVRKRFGLQFHPEVDDTIHGENMLGAFAEKICGCRGTWTMGDYAQEAIAQIRSKAGDREVLLLVSGGVDSTVCAWLLSRALGAEKLHLLHIDNGLMRLRESESVVERFKKNQVSQHVHFVDAGEEFVRALEGVTAPEKKRRIIGDTFIRVLEREARKLDLDRFVMAQGTIYPDTIETGGTRRAVVIKTHHNRVPVVQEMIAAGKMIEPLADLYKTEVRELGREMGIPEEALDRYPFPGPGLGVRVLAATGSPPPSHHKELETRVQEVSRRGGFEGRLIPVQSVGVKADLRSYEQPVVLWRSEFGAEEACELTVELINELEGVNRCVLLYGEGLPRELIPVRAEMTFGRLDLLRAADAAVRRVLDEVGLTAEIWQCPVVLVPVGDGEGRRELLVVRPVYSQRAMTAKPVPLRGEVMKRLHKATAELGDLWGIALDVTAKPPGTIEWE